MAAPTPVGTIITLVYALLNLLLGRWSELEHENLLHFGKEGWWDWRRRGRVWLAVEEKVPQEKNGRLGYSSVIAVLVFKTVPLRSGKEEEKEQQQKKKKMSPV